MRITVDRSQLKIKEHVRGIEKASKYGTKVIADQYRDRLRENYAKNIHRGRYGRSAPHSPTSSKSMTNYLVTSSRMGGEIQSVGPKRGGMYTSQTSEGSPSNMRTYEEIFGFQSAGYTLDKPKAFRLREDRASASPNKGGYWVIKYMPKNTFAEDTYREYVGGRFQLETTRYMAPIIRKELKKL